MAVISKQQGVTPDKLGQVISWLDCELAETYFRGYCLCPSMDTLLELRRCFTADLPLQQLIVKFYQLLPALEDAHYIVGYRIRQWFSLYTQVTVSDPLERTPPHTQPLCQTTRSLETFRKSYFEQHDYAIPYHDIRLTISAID